MMSTYYKGRITYKELYDMPAGEFNVLYNIVIDRNSSEEGKKQLEAEAVEDALEEGGVM